MNLLDLVKSPSQLPYSEFLEKVLAIRKCRFDRSTSSKAVKERKKKETKLSSALNPNDLDKLISAIKRKLKK